MSQILDEAYLVDLLFATFALNRPVSAKQSLKNSHRTWFALSANGIQNHLSNPDVARLVAIFCSLLKPVLPFDKQKSHIRSHILPVHPWPQVENRCIFQVLLNPGLLSFTF